MRVEHACAHGYVRLGMDVLCTLLAIDVGVHTSRPHASGERGKPLVIVILRGARKRSEDEEPPRLAPPMSSKLKKTLAPPVLM